MKFGKQLLTQQTTEWAAHYINYKALKKIINSLPSAYKNNERSLPPTPAITVTLGAPRNNDLPQAADHLQQQKAAFFFKLFFFFFFSFRLILFIYKKKKNSMLDYELYMIKKEFY